VGVGLAVLSLYRRVSPLYVILAENELVQKNESMNVGHDILSRNKMDVLHFVLFVSALKEHGIIYKPVCIYPCFAYKKTVTYLMCEKIKSIPVSYIK
jgi:hypothetical protein